jgi:hypothetical protein
LTRETPNPDNGRQRVGHGEEGSIVAQGLEEGLAFALLVDEEEPEGVADLGLGEGSHRYAVTVDLVRLPVR